MSQAGALIVLVTLGAAYAQTPDPAFFSKRLYLVFEQAQCRNCHTHDGVASGTRLHFPEPDASTERIQAFGVSLAPLVDRAYPAKSLLLNKPTARVRHTGGERIKPGSEQDAMLASWVRYLATVPDEAVSAARRLLDGEVAPVRSERRVRRLTHSQYNNTIRDLMGDRTRPADRFPPEDFVNGFKNQFSVQNMPPLLVEAYSRSAEKLALNAFRAGDVNHLIPCTPKSAADEKCRDRFVRRFGGRAFRRPLSDAEYRRYTALFATQARSTGKFLEGARAVVEVMLQSPKFLCRVESGPGSRIRDYGIASRLSYMLWDSMPDDALLDAAAAGELRTAAGIETSARRMLKDPRARQATGEFFQQWLRLERVTSAVKDGPVYPQFTPALAAMMVEETHRLLDDLVWNDRNFMQALTADYAFLNPELAALYGLKPPAGEFQKVAFPAGSRRGGLLGEASFLTGTAGPVETSPTSRGVFIREQLLCQHVPAPPPGVNTNLPEPDPNQPRTRQQRLVAHVENQTCAACHRLMDPIGLGLEHFDAIGRWRDKEHIEIRPFIGDVFAPKRQVKRFDLDIEAHGEVAGIAHSVFADPVELGPILAASPVCQECVVRQVYRYACGRLETSADEQTIRGLYDIFRKSGFQFRALLLGLVQTPTFLEEGIANGNQPAQTATRR
jgi:hypothetical protein